jgi:hypothetical protein
MKQRTVVSALVLAAVLSTARVSEAQPAVADGPLSTLGGKLLAGGDSAIATGFGWPGLFFEYDIGVSNAFNLGFRGDLYFGNPFGGFDVGLGFGFSVPMRVRIAQLRRVDIAVELAPRFYVGQLDANRRDFSDKAFVIGFGFEPGILIGVRVHRQVNIVAGASFPFLIALDVDHEEMEVWFPVVAFGGAELGLSERFNLFGAISVGPAIHGGGDRTRAEALFALVFGLQWKL